MKATLQRKAAIGLILAAIVLIAILITEFSYTSGLARIGIVLNLIVFVILFFIINREIAQRERATRTLSESEEQFRQLVQHAGDIIYRTDREGFFTFVNATAESLMGYQPDELLGRHFLDPVVPAQREQVARFYRQQFAEQTPNTFHYFPVARKDGSEMWVAQTVQLIFQNGKIVGAQGVARDATQRVQLQEEVGRARDAALESARLKSEFFANMSHEIRTPMNGIIGMTSLLNDTRLDSEQRHFVDCIRESADALLSVINDILDFSKIEAGKIELAPLDFDLSAALESVVDLFQEAAQSKNLELTSEIDSDVPKVLHADSLRLRQVLINLVGNAIKFTNEGGVELSVNCVGQSDTDANLRFEVRDTGIGISEKARVHLFTAFTQADGSTARRFGGTGLGLAISKQLVEAWGGEIGVDSLPAKGSSFWFTLKAGKQHASSLTRESPFDLEVPSAGRISTNLQPEPTDGLKLLIAEDNPINQQVARYQVEKLAYQADVARDGLTALALVDQNDYDLILMDCHMPEMDGFETCRRIRSRPDRKKEIPIIAVTASGGAAEREKCRQAGMNDFLLKPFHKEELSAIIQKWLSRSSPFEKGNRSQDSSGADSSGEVARALKQLEEDYGKEMVLKIVEMFIPDADVRIGKIERAVAQQDFQTLEEAAHGLKSGAANLGAKEMARFCEELETRGETRSLSEAAELLAKLRDSWTDVRSQVIAYH